MKPIPTAVHIFFLVACAAACWIATTPFVFWINLVAVVINLGIITNRLTPEDK